MQMFNQALMKKGGDEVRGNYISYDAATEFFQVTGGTKTATGTNGRVRAVLQPKPKDKPANAAGALPKTPQSPQSPQR
jgi:lipopolysaccharide export system protein LptA